MFPSFAWFSEGWQKRGGAESQNALAYLCTFQADFLFATHALLALALQSYTKSLLLLPSRKALMYTTDI